MNTVMLTGVLYALSDPVRLNIVYTLAQAGREDGGLACSKFLLYQDRTVPKSTLSQHLRILRENGVIYSEPRGVEMLNRLRCDELGKRFPGLLNAILSAV